MPTSLKRIGAIALALCFFTCSVRAQDVAPSATPKADSASPAATPLQNPTPQNPAEKPTRIRISGNVASAKLIHQVAPVYPVLAKTAHITGTVVLHCIIAKDGTVEDLQLISGHQDARARRDRGSKAVGL